MNGELTFAGDRVEFDGNRIVSTSRGVVLFEAEPESEIKKVETNGKNRLFVLVRGRASASKTNVFAIDQTGKVVWRAKRQPSDYDDELVDMRYKEPLLEVWSWNLVYEFDGRSGELVRSEPNK